MTHTEARRRTKLATTLDRHDPTREAMAAGQVLADQASAICAAVEELPADPGVRALCEKELVGLAEHYDAKGLKEQGRKVLAIVDPDAADAHLGKLLEREERAAAKATSFSIWETGDGTVPRQVHAADPGGRHAEEGRDGDGRAEARTGQR